MARLEELIDGAAVSGIAKTVPYVLSAEEHALYEQVTSYVPQEFNRADTLDGDPSAAWVLMERRAGGERTVTIRGVPYAIDDTLALMERTPDYPNFARPGMQAAYKRMLMEGRHWRHYLYEEQSG